MFRKGPVAFSVIGERGSSFAGKGWVSSLGPDQGRVRKGNTGIRRIKKYKRLVDSPFIQRRFIGALKVTYSPRGKIYRLYHRRVGHSAILCTEQKYVGGTKITYKIIHRNNMGVP